MKSNLVKVTYLLGLLVVCSSIYSHTYWSAFDIEIFPYLEISELIMYGLGELINKLIPPLIGVIIAFLFLDNLFPYGGYEKAKNNEKESGEILITKFEKVVRIFLFIHLVGLFPGITIFYYFTDIERFYFFLPLSVALFSFLVTDKLMKYDIIGEINIDSKIIYLSIYLLLSSYSTGKLNSIKIKENKEFKYTANNRTFKKLIGNGGGFYFFKSLCSEETYIIKDDKIQELKYYYFNGKISTKNDSLINAFLNK
jgi:hypothetical protein